MFSHCVRFAILNDKNVWNSTCTLLNIAIDKTYSCAHLNITRIVAQMINDG